MARKKYLGRDGRWRDSKGHFTSPPKKVRGKQTFTMADALREAARLGINPFARPAPPPEPVAIGSLGDALQALSDKGVAFTMKEGATPPIDATKPRKEVPVSGKKKLLPQEPDPIFRFRDDKTHIDMRQARGDLEEIKRWIREWEAEWHRNKDGSYQAMLYYGEDEPYQEGPEDALDRLQTAAEDLPGPCLLRYGLWYVDEDDTEETYNPRKGGSPRPRHEDEETDTVLELHYTRLVREYDQARSLADGYRHGHPEPDRGRLQVMFPSIKGDER
jgi:hypothetical protein